MSNRKLSSPSKCLLALLLAVPCVGWSGTVGLYFDTSSSSNCLPNPPSYPHVTTIYIVAHGLQASVHGFEGRIEWSENGFLSLGSLPNGGRNYSQFPDLRVGYETPVIQAEDTVLGSLQVVAVDSMAIDLAGLASGTIPGVDHFIAVVDGEEIVPLYSEYGWSSSHDLIIGCADCPIEDPYADWEASTYVAVGEKQLCLYGNWVDPGYVEVRADAQTLFIGGWRAYPVIENSLRGAVRSGVSPEGELYYAAKKHLKKNMNNTDTDAADRELLSMFEESDLVSSVECAAEEFRVEWKNQTSVVMPLQQRWNETCRKYEESKARSLSSVVGAQAEYIAIVDHLEADDLVYVNSWGKITIPAISRKISVFSDALLAAETATGPITAENWSNDRPFPFYFAEQLRVPLPETMKRGY